MTKQVKKHSFQTEVSKLLDIVANALYSDRQIFLRELLSNASDACDKLRYESVKDKKLADKIKPFRIAVEVNVKKNQLIIHDNGIGMTQEELIENLGTIAKSGTSDFVSHLTGDEKNDANLIGQFGVGFYAAFMVSEYVEVISQHAKSDEAFAWRSDGKGNFEIEPATRDQCGTTIILHLKDDAKEFLEEVRLRHIVKRYSDHIPYPIMLVGEEGEAVDEFGVQLNKAQAIWRRSKDEITEEEYNAFYREVALTPDMKEEPGMTLHRKTEGSLEYTSLLYIPSKRPLDLFNPDRLPKVKLYVQRVLIMDDCSELVPSYLRFLRGVVDCDDLSLNISREMLQQDTTMTKIKTSLTKHVLSELEKQFKNDRSVYEVFWDLFGSVLKEGIYEDMKMREKIMDISLFPSLIDDKKISLQEYVDAMLPDQEHIYYITGDSVEALKRSPQIEGFKERGINVLLLTDPIDDFWAVPVGAYKEKSFQSVTKGDIDLSKFKSSQKEAQEPLEDISDVIAFFKETLKDKVKDVKPSSRLQGSPVCLVADAGDMDMRLTRLLKGAQELEKTDLVRVLEINPSHTLVKKVSEGLKNKSKKDIEKVVFLLFDLAHIIEGEPLQDSATFRENIFDVIEKGLSS